MRFAESLLRDGLCIDRGETWLALAAAVLLAAAARVGAPFERRATTAVCAAGTAVLTAVAVWRAWMALP